MSLNQVTQNSNKPWLIAKTYNLIIDGEIKITHPNAREGDILQCVSSGEARFVPQNINPTLQIDYVSINTLLSTVPGFFSFSLPPTWTATNFTIGTDPTELTCNTTGSYLITKKIAINAPANGGVKSETTVNSVVNGNSVLAIQNSPNSYTRTGVSTGFVVNLVNGDVIKEAFTPYGASFQSYEQTTYMQLMRIG